MTLLYIIGHCYISEDCLSHALHWAFMGMVLPHQKTQGLFTIAFSSLHGVGTTRDTRLVYTNVNENDLVPGALNALFKYLAWAMNTLLVGWAD